MKNAKLREVERFASGHTADLAQLCLAQKSFSTRGLTAPLLAPTTLPSLQMPTHPPHLFDVQEVLGLEGDGHSLNRHLIP